MLLILRQYSDPFFTYHYIPDDTSRFQVRGRDLRKFRNSVTDNKSHKFYTSGLISIFTCEAIAILQALKLASSHEIETIVVFSDSQNVLQNLCNNTKSFKKSPILLEILNLIEMLSFEGKLVKYFGFQPIRVSPGMN